MQIFAFFGGPPEGEGAARFGDGPAVGKQPSRAHPQQQRCLLTVGPGDRLHSLPFAAWWTPLTAIKVVTLSPANF